MALIKLNPEKIRQKILHKKLKSSSLNPPTASFLTGGCPDCCGCCGCPPCGTLCVQVDRTNPQGHTVFNASIPYFTTSAPITCGFSIGFGQGNPPTTFFRIIEIAAWVGHQWQPQTVISGRVDTNCAAGAFCPSSGCCGTVVKYGSPVTGTGIKKCLGIGDTLTFETPFCAPLQAVGITPSTDIWTVQACVGNEIFGNNETTC